MEGQLLDQSLLKKMKTQQGPTLEEITSERMTLLIFLRNFGCTFCRQALKDIASIKPKLDEKNVTVVFVHLSEEETAYGFFEKRGLEDCYRISDPEARYYQAFGLTKGTMRQLFGLQNWIKGFQSSTLELNGLSMPVGDAFQMPGVFILHDNEIKLRYIHDMASDRPDYLGLIDQVDEHREVAT